MMELCEFPHPKGTPVWFLHGRNHKTGRTMYRKGVVFGKRGTKYQIEVGGNRLYLVPSSNVKLHLDPAHDEAYIETRTPARGYYVPRRK